MLRSCIPHDTLSLAPFIPSPQDPINLSFSISPARPHSSPSGPPLASPRVFVREVGRKTFIVSGPCKPPTREKVPAYQDSEWRRRERAHVRSSCNARPRVEGSKNTRARGHPECTWNCSGSRVRGKKKVDFTTVPLPDSISRAPNLLEETKHEKCMHVTSKDSPIDWLAIRPLGHYYTRLNICPLVDKRLMILVHYGELIRE